MGRKDYRKADTIVKGPGKAAKRQQDLGIASKATPSSSRRQKKKQKALLGLFKPVINCVTPISSARRRS